MLLTQESCICNTILTCQTFIQPHSHATQCGCWGHNSEQVNMWGRAARLQDIKAERRKEAEERPLTAAHRVPKRGQCWIFLAHPNLTLTQAALLSHFIEHTPVKLKSLNIPVPNR